MIAFLLFGFYLLPILDTPLSFFISLWLGALIAFLYFNIYPRLEFG
jgi:UDP-N-acetylmuramyl pentapeptide phosphotransferase/UDP-N-acetylglucosamine-1-phosphate transferase